MKKIVLIASITLSFLILSCSANSGPAAGSGTDGNTQNGGSGGGTTAPLTDIEIFANNIKNKKVTIDGVLFVFTAQGKKLRLISGYELLIHYAYPPGHYLHGSAIYYNPADDATEGYKYRGFMLSGSAIRTTGPKGSMSDFDNGLTWASLPWGLWSESAID